MSTIFAAPLVVHRRDGADLVHLLAGSAFLDDLAIAPNVTFAVRDATTGAPPFTLTKAPSGLRVQPGDHFTVASAVPFVKKCRIGCSSSLPDDAFCHIDGLFVLR